MIYPDNFETKVGFDEIRKTIKGRCLSTLGKEMVDNMSFSTDADAINTQMAEIREFRRIIEKQEDFPLDNFHDVREALKRVRIVNTHLEESELFDLRRSLDTLHRIKRFLIPPTADEQPAYPTLALLAEEVTTTRPSSSASTRFSTSSATSATRLRPPCTTSAGNWRAWRAAFRARSTAFCTPRRAKDWWTRT